MTRRINEDPDISHYLQMGICYLQLGEPQNAEKFFLTTLQHDEDNIEARQELAKLYDGVDKEQAALMRQEVKDIVKKATEKLQRLGKEAQNDSEKPVKTFIARKTYKPSRKKYLQPDPDAEIKAKLEEARIANLLRSYETVQRCKAGLEAGDVDETSEWMAAARELVTDFRTIKGLYPYDKFYYSPHFVSRSEREKAKAVENANRIAAPNDDDKRRPILQGKSFTSFQSA